MAGISDSIDKIQVPEVSSGSLDSSLERLEVSEEASQSGVSQVSLSLEQIVKMTNTIGLKYAEAKKVFDRLDLFKNVVKARISMRIEEQSQEKLTEVKLKRLTETDSEYTAYLDKLVRAKNLVENLKIRYDSYKNLFEAKRSMLSYQKAELKLL